MTPCSHFLCQLMVHVRKSMAHHVFLVLAHSVLVVALCASCHGRCLRSKVTLFVALGLRWAGNVCYLSMNNLTAVHVCMCFLKPHVHFVVQLSLQDSCILLLLYSLALAYEGRVGSCGNLRGAFLLATYCRSGVGHPSNVLT